MDHLLHRLLLPCLPCLLLLSACSPTIDLPQPVELKVKQIAGSPAPRVELSWKLIVRVDGYLLHYSANKAGPPYAGKGLAVVPWPEGCGDLDAGTAKATDAVSTIATDVGLPDSGADAGSPDKGQPDMGAPDQGPPDKGAPDKGTLDQGQPDKGTPDKGTPDKGTPDKGTPAPGAASPIKIPVSWCLDREDTFKDAGKIPVHTPGTRPRLRLQNLRVGRTYHFAVQAFRRAGTSAMSQPVSITIKDKIK